MFPTRRSLKQRGERDNVKTNTKTNTNILTHTQTNTHKYKDKYCGALSSREEKETMLKQIQKLIQRNTKSTITNINKYIQKLIQIMRR